MSRYRKQAAVDVIGAIGQTKIERAHVLVIGAGALGSTISEYVVRAGIGRLTVVDRDYVELSNLQRQTLYTEADAQAERPKAEALGERLRAVNSEVSIETFTFDWTWQTAKPFMDQLPNVDVIVDATDNFATRFLLNDLSYSYDIPWI
ncbi:MAG: HesA/MoeB/ThiF family protein, partial [Bacilli bacterium]